MLKKVIGGLIGLSLCDNKKVECCGIIGVVSKDKDVSEYIYEGLSILQNRGYDSAGISTINKNNNKIITTKYASINSTSNSINLLKDNLFKHNKNYIGIGHTRWATNGGKTDNNAHPHTDINNNISVVHNGTIINYKEIKDDLIKKGYKFKSDTDTEVIPQLIEYYYNKNNNLFKSINLTLKRLIGTWGLVVLSSYNPNELIITRNGSPMVIGLSENTTFIASETSAFNKYTKKFISLEDGEIVTISNNGTSINDIKRIKLSEDLNIKLSPKPYKYWTLKECHEQSKVIEQALDNGGRINNNEIILGGLNKEIEYLLSIENLIITGCGTSLNAGLYGKKLMNKYKSFNTVSIIDSAEFSNNSIPLNKGGILAISQSGETKDVYNAVMITKNNNIPIFSIINTVGSLIARTTNLGVYLNAGRENAVASTKSFTSQVVVLSLITLWFSQNRNYNNNLNKRIELIESLQRLSLLFNIAKNTRNKCKNIAKFLLDKEHLFILGKGYAESIAYEGALKIKEISYLHAEGYSGGALKHGPFALININTPIICIVLNDEHLHTMNIALNELHARNSYIIVITDNINLIDNNIVNDIIEIPNNKDLTALIAILPLQLIAYELALLKNINPDVPKNLAKVVTVD